MMEKKKYMEPEMLEFEIQTSRMLSYSLESNEEWNWDDDVDDSR